MDARTKIIYQEIRTETDTEGNTTNKKTTNVIKLPPELAFFKCYLTDVGILLGLPYKAIVLMIALLIKMDFENVITLTPRKKRQLIEQVEISPQTLDNYLRKLVDADILKRLDRGEYFFNPNYFAKGDWASIKDKVEEWELVVTYRNDGTRTIKGKANLKNEELDSKTTTILNETNS